MTCVFSRWLLTAAVILGVISGAIQPVLADDEPDPQSAPASNRVPTFVHLPSAGALQLRLEPPSVGAVILDDTLTGSGVITEAASCGDGRNVRELVDEGMLMKVTGVCQAGQTSAGIAVGPVVGLDVPDGEARVDFKLVSGANRAVLTMPLRSRLENGCLQSYMPIVDAAGEAALYKTVGCGQPAAVLSARRDLAGQIRRGDWNTLAMRLEGPNLWLLLNDELILSAADGSYDHGLLSVVFARSGDVNDSAETAAVFRNLRVSELLPRGSADENVRGAQ